MTIEEAASFFGISKEAIHNRIRRGRLKAIVEDGVKLVLVSKEMQQPKQKVAKVQDRYNTFLELQNQELKEKIERLEAETRTLREEKERYLIEERERIEQIYKEKDEQLKNILNAISSKFLLEAKPLQEEENQPIEVEIEEQPKKLISLKKFLASMELSKKKEQKLKDKIKKLAKKDKRFIKKEKKIYLDIKTYDYSDIVS